MRLIDAEALKTALINRLSEDDSRITEIIEEEIDNAPTGEWIPIKYRPMTEEEKNEIVEEYGKDYGDIEMFDCSLPDDGQEVLISTPWGIVITAFYTDYGYYFDGYEDKGDVVAWMPLPEPYKKGGDNE